MFGREPDRWAARAGAAVEEPLAVLELLVLGDVVV
jgi:hypothetical protein